MFMRPEVSMVAGRRVLFFLFFLSGFCSLVYQVVWTRMAFASFGVIAPVLSVVISVFMLGLSVGAWGGGRWIGTRRKKTARAVLLFYALTELTIGVGAFAVPRLFDLGERIMLFAGSTDSVAYLLLSAVILVFSILPWCILMGATTPLVMAYLQEREQQSTESFSFLYVANVLGAMSGAALAAVVLIEVFGFKGVLAGAAAGNLTISMISGYLAWRQSPPYERASTQWASPLKLELEARRLRTGRLLKWLLFCTGFSAMAMEVVWARAFTPVLRTQVYSFAMIIFAYLGATFVGSTIYRRDVQRSRVRSLSGLLSLISVAAFLPIVLNDGRFLSSRFLVTYGVNSVILLLSIWPLCALLGYLTPGLIDEQALGKPAAAGKAYAVNICGCILGPLVASYVLLPSMGERHALILLALPFLIFFFITRQSLPSWYRNAIYAGIGSLLIWSLVYSIDFADYASQTIPPAQVRRDYAASVVSAGKDLGKLLFVNGVGVTHLAPETKFMIHLPLLVHTGKAESALIICFGMGTTFRSGVTWDIETTAVELVPSVKEAFGFYHSDAAKILSNPRAHIVVDDGRRYLKRTRQKFDVVVIDPPPPVETAGSSLLYSEEFYELVKQRLKPNGIVQVWYPRARFDVEQAILRSVQNSFSHMQCFDSLSVEGTHVLASMEPITVPSGKELAAKMPAAAATDLLEWSSSEDLPAYLNGVLAHHFANPGALNPDLSVRITDDRPYNEYFLLRRWGLLKIAKP
jgi:spermidine synthase